MATGPSSVCETKSALPWLESKRNERYNYPVAWTSAIFECVNWAYSMRANLG
ncbi:hypothetical protein K443DRAFT_680759 [Laccaria amethystina LaAM-08-1]|uniref:Uncharacterized protein n=1 Tax=Laccaria amethystina LaAM-08-1 TaxID=1095629 RepID=A0A0C9XLR3_9AGAR|nr:hypothetical protein K443DRAFT_680759 [Laccaria amethystina LaAM-08-1]